MHERLHKALQGTNQTRHLKRSREQYVKSTNSFTEYYRFERNLSFPAWFVSNISPQLTFKFLNCYFYLCGGQDLSHTIFVKGTPKVVYLLLCSGAPMLRAEGREGLLCAMFALGCWCWERKEVDRCFVNYVFCRFNFLICSFFEHIVKLVPEKFGEGCFWMKRMVRVEQLELPNTCLVTREWGS